MTVLAVVQARMGSSRLPGKVLRELGHQPILGWVVDAAVDANSVDRVVIATSELPQDDAIAAFAVTKKVQCIRGSLEDVLARFVRVIEHYPSDVIVRLTGDCPFLDSRVIDHCIALLECDQSLDFVSNVSPRTYPRGLDVEAFRPATLTEADTCASGSDRVHVTSWIARSPDRFKLGGVTMSPSASDLRVTIDTPEDLSVAYQAVASLGLDARRVETLVRWLRAHPEVTAINKFVRQKELFEG